jgi:predicted acylesterase/phospholipase RssA
MSATPTPEPCPQQRPKAVIPKHPARECDLVMKGGITSGLVYPSAILQLAQQYRFRNIGGTSVGAIAAAVVAAAELGRQMGAGTGFDELEQMNAEVLEPGFVLELFQPQSGSRAAFDLLIAGMDTKASPLAKLRAIVGVLFRRVTGVIVPALILWVASLVVFGFALGDRWWVLAVAIVAWGIITGAVLAVRYRSRRLFMLGSLAGLALAFVWPILLGATAVGASTFASFNRDWFGMCLGTSSTSAPALTEWLHHHIQRCVGRKTDGPGEESRPVTFGDLAEHDIDLQMVTTNLSTTRPLRLPADCEDYFFKEEEFAKLFPARVVRHLTDHAREDDALKGQGFWAMPAPKDLPVLVAFRLSLSFPVLFSGVPVYSYHPFDSKAIVPNWLSDGGASSNFPIHFFDAWLPSRPTFGLSLGPYPQDAHGKRIPGEGDVGVPGGPKDDPRPLWAPIGGMVSFLHQILDTMENWRDTMQSELPGFQDRVYQVRLSDQEGGLNLNMDHELICDLIDKGWQAGSAINKRFDWDQHFFTRYVTAMQMLQIGLIGEEDPVTHKVRRGAHQNFEPLRTAFDDGYPGEVWRFDHDAAWCKEAGADTWTMAEAAKRWVRAASGSYPGFAGFNSGTEPRPKPAMRVVPRV